MTHYAFNPIEALNRWASYRVSVGLARACGWPKPVLQLKLGEVTVLEDGTRLVIRQYGGGA